MQRCIKAIGSAFAALLFVLMASGTASAATTAGPVVPGQTTTVTCGEGQQVRSVTVDYFTKNGKLLDPVAPTEVRNSFGEIVSADYVAPRKAAYVAVSTSCRIASSVVYREIDRPFIPAGGDLVINSCPAGTVASPTESWMILGNNPLVYLQDLPYTMYRHVVIVDYGTLDPAQGDVLYIHNTTNEDVTGSILVRSELYCRAI
jgi:hypothetical protein